MLDSMLLEVRRVSHSEDLLIAGDYVFIPARPPIVVTESIPLDAPRGFFKRLWWGWFGAKCVVKKTEEEVWAAYDVIIMVCPVCRQPLATKREHSIVSVEPLTRLTREESDGAPPDRGIASVYADYSSGTGPVRTILSQPESPALVDRFAAHGYVNHDHGTASRRIAGAFAR
jgi:uncharacterized protein YbaR (Trm112 family)